ncbi:MAG: hypothetical protein A2V88_05035 [Elusimicrobia bacterium RBG_16_66_12]|nr:MAG: hypothetical protein A2V88_05035 [Elusimicrobia bacterium RBG_16_66_12]
MLAGAVPVVGFCGPRSLGPAGCAWVASAARAVVVGGSVVAAGCAVGADAAAVSGALSAPGGSARLRVFAVGSASGFGFPRAGYPAAVAAAFVARAASVSWLAGGVLSVPLPARLAARSLAFVRFLAASGGALVVAASSLPSRPFGPGPFPSCGSGSWSSAAAAVLAGVPVFVAPFGVSPAAFPALPGGGAWVAVPGGLWGLPASRWAPAGVAVPLPGFASVGGGALR